MGGDKQGLRATGKGDLQQVPAVQAQNGPAVGTNVADGFQPAGQGVRRLQAGQQDEVMDLTGAAVALIDAADLPAYHEPGRLAAKAPAFRQPGFLLEGIQAFLRRLQGLLQGLDG